MLLLYHCCLNACTCPYRLGIETRIGIPEIVYNIINAVHRDAVSPLSITAKRKVYTLQIMIYIILATAKMAGALVLHCECADMCSCY